MTLVSKDQRSTPQAQ